jgi:hypothetical protein
MGDSSDVGRHLTALPTGAASHDTPSSPPRAPQGPQQEHAAYSLPVLNRQLIKHGLRTYRLGSLAAIEAIANSVAYNGNVAYRNDLILDTELRTSNILTQYFIDGGVAELQPGYNLRRDEQGWKAVSNQVFFNAIRVARVEQFWSTYGFGTGRIVFSPNHGAQRRRGLVRGLETNPFP